MMNKICFYLIALLYVFSSSRQSFAQDSRQTELFTEAWKFYKGDEPAAQAEGFDDAAWRTVELPHDWSIEGPFSQEWASGTGFLPAGIGWYRKTWEVGDAASGKKQFIYFDGVYKNSEVWLNGRLLGKRPNGYIPFQYELTPYLKKGKNVLAVRVDHTKFADSRWYPGSGIYRNVYLVTKNPVHIALWGTRFVTPQVTKQNAKANVTITLNNTTNGAAALRVVAQLSREGKTVATGQKELSVAPNRSQEVSLSVEVKQPALWSIDHPHLYTLTSTVYQGGKKVDVYSEKVGFRSLRFDARNGFFLNGESTKLKGVCLHHDAGALGAAVPREVWQRRLQKLKEVGCNAIRMSHYPHQDYLYELCDEMGFLVQDEAFDEWALGKNKWIQGWNVGKPGKDGYHEFFEEWADRDLTDMIQRNKNHPSIIMWSIGNEIDYPNDPYSHEVLSTGRNPQIYGRGFLPDNPPASRLGELSQRLVAVAKKTDTSRPITAALAGVVMSNETSYPGNLDLVGYKYQEYRYADDHSRFPDRIIYGSENNRSPDAWKAVDTSKNIFGQFLWTGFDFMGEAGRWPTRSSGAGLLDLAGYPKTDFYTRQTLWLNQPVVHVVVSKAAQERGRRITKHSWNWTAGDTLRVAAITNAEETELFLNGKSLGKKASSDTSRDRLSWMVLFEPGELVVKGYNNGRLSTSDTLTTAGDAALLTATMDKKAFSGGVKETAHLELVAKDKEGHPVYGATNEVTVVVEGPAKLLGLESGDLNSHEDYKATKRKLYNGRLLAYVQSTGKPGYVKITIQSPGLPGHVIRVSSGN